MTKLGKFGSSLLAGVFVLGAAAGNAGAEVKEVSISWQYGLGQVPMMVMQHREVVEKYLKAAGLNDTKVKWTQTSGASAMSDALISKSLDFATIGTPGAAKLWAATAGKIKAMGAASSVPFYLYTNNPKLRTLRDFTSTDKIAVPAVKVSFQAIVLQMAAEKEFGDHAKLDNLTVALSNPDAFVAVTSGRGVVNSHIGSPPFQDEALKDPKIHRVLSSFDVLGGPATINLVVTHQDFYDKNPKTYKAVADALKEAIDAVNRDKRAAAQLYIDVSGFKRLTVDEMTKILESPELKYSDVPHKTMQILDFLHKHGQLKVKPNSWKDIFFPNVHGLQGAS